MSTTTLQGGLDEQLKGGYSIVELGHSEAAKIGLPLDACSEGHYLKAHLFVTESGTTEKLQSNRKVGQTIVLTSCNDGHTGIYSRTGEFGNHGAVEWQPWSPVSDGAVNVVWGAGSSMNNHVTGGTYNITGQRLNAADGLPIANSNPGHTIHARLLVLDSSIPGTGDNDDKCVTQILTLSNRTGGDGDVYVRTGRASSKNQLAGGYGWEAWGKLQQNIEVGQVSSLDSYTGNGIYSGVHTDGNTLFETFVMVVINNYAVAGATGKVRSISQFKYALNVDGTFSYKTRTGQGNTGISWGNWVDIGAATTTDIQDGAVTAQKLSSALQEQINKSANGAYWTSGPNAVTLNINKNDGTVGSQTLPVATTEKAGVMSAGDKKEIKDINSRLGFNEGTIAFSSSNLLPMVWNGTKMVSSTVYNIWVLPLYEGRHYSMVNKAYFLSRKTCSEYPVLNKELPMENIPADTFTATSEMKYLVLQVKMSDYDGSDYEIEAGELGLCEDVKNIKHVSLPILAKNLSDVISNVGSLEKTVELTPDDFYNIVWNGNSLVTANATYNSILIPIFEGQSVTIDSINGRSNMWGFKSLPLKGTDEIPTQLSNDVNTFLGTSELRYILINVRVDTFTEANIRLSSTGIEKKIEALINSVDKPLRDKTIVCFGDSITEFNGDDNKGYGDYLAELSGATVVRGGIGGTQLATRKQPVEVIPDNEDDYKHAYGAVDISNLAKAWANKDWGIVDNAVAWLATNKNDDNSAVIDRLKNCPIENADIVIVFGGTNDLNNSTYGKPTDTDAVGSVCGGINQIIDSILTVKPDMVIYFFTPIPRMATSEIWCDDYRTDQSDAHGSLSFPSLVKRIKECVEYNHIPCCDMYNTIGINRKNIYTYADDGVHPNHGYSLLANRMYGFIMANRNWL